jgi:two-component system probable response regulator PhcQ
MQAEARRGAAMAAHLRQWLETFGADRTGATPLELLARAVGGEVRGAELHLPSGEPFSALLSGAVDEAPGAAQCAWPAWLLWQRGLGEVQAIAGGGLLVKPAESVSPRTDWLADLMERLGQPAH